MKNQADQYQELYNDTFKIINPEDVIPNLRDLIEDMILIIRELEESNSKEYQTKRLKLEASARTGIN